MNRIQKVGVAIACATSMVFAADPWWVWDVAYGQVAFPWVVACQSDKSKFDPEESDNECYKTLGGWWFGYLAGPADKIGPNVNGCRVDMAGKQPATSTADHYVKAKINGSWVSLVGPDNDGTGTTSDAPICNGPDVTNRGNGDSYLEDEKGLALELAVSDGINGPAVWEPSIAAVAVNFSTPPGGDQGDIPPVFVKRNMDQIAGGGFCMKYESDHLPADNFNIELGWDETNAETLDNRARYDGYVAKIPAGSGVQVKDFVWSTDCTKSNDARICGDFEQEGWSKPSAYPIDSAIYQMMSFKISYKAYVPGVVHFKLIAFGPKGSCGAATPITVGKIAQSNVRFSLEGRTLLASINKSAEVQIYNLQGAMVKSQTLTEQSNRMNLSNLPTGIYMVRAPSLGYTSRIVVK